MAFHDLGRVAKELSVNIRVMYLKNELNICVAVRNCALINSAKEHCVIKIKIYQDWLKKKESVIINLYAYGFFIQYTNKTASTFFV